MWNKKRLMHKRSVRFANNGGIAFPVCKVPMREGTLLDLEQTRLRTTGDPILVTCPRCKSRMADNKFA